MAKKVLMIVEGEYDEIRFFKRLFKECFKKTDYQFYSYKTNIHVLAQELYNNYPSFETDDIDLRLVLASLEEDPKKKELLTANYTDIYLVFDFDPQHCLPHFDTVRRMIKFFNDSTTSGKLFINYPMMQSYKHFSVLPDHSFSDKAVGLNEIRNYKQLVGTISGYKDLNRYDYVIFYSIAVHHLKKANYILSNDDSIPSYQEYLAFDLIKLYDAQEDLFRTESRTFVLNTCIFVLSDYSPKSFFNFVSTHKKDLLI